MKMIIYYLCLSLLVLRIGTPQDCKSSGIYFSLAADEIHEAKKALNLKNYHRAYTILEPLAEAGHPEALNLLGEMWYYGLGVHQDFSKAFQYFKLASDKGHAGAPNHIGNMYLKGQSQAANTVEAFRWFMVSAKRGYALGQYNVGMCYEQGIGVPKDLEKAGSWFGLAEKNQPGLLKEQQELSMEDLGNIELLDGFP